MLNVGHHGPDLLPRRGNVDGQLYVHTLLLWSSRKGRTERESDPSLPAAQLRARVRPYTTVPSFSSLVIRIVLAPLVDSPYTVSTLSCFTDPHERVAPRLHPFLGVLLPIDWDLPDRSVREPETGDAAFRRLQNKTAVIYGGGGAIGGAILRSLRPARADDAPGAAGGEQMTVEEQMPRGKLERMVYEGDDWLKDRARCGLPSTSP